MTDQELYEQATAASADAYAPYSKFLVGAAALLRDGRVITGVNVAETPPIPSECARSGVRSHGRWRRSAPRRCRSGGRDRLAVRRLRQWLYEFGVDRIAFWHEDGLLVRTPTELLPGSFEL